MIKELEDFSNYLEENYISKGLYPTLSPFGGDGTYFELQLRVTTKDTNYNLTIRRGGYEGETFQMAFETLFLAIDRLMCFDLVNKSNDFFKGFTDGWDWAQNYSHSRWAKGGEVNKDFKEGYEAYLVVQKSVRLSKEKYKLN